MRRQFFPRAVLPGVDIVADLQDFAVDQVRLGAAVDFQKALPVFEDEEPEPGPVLCGVAHHLAEEDPAEASEVARDALERGPGAGVAEEHFCQRQLFEPRCFLAGDSPELQEAVLEPHLQLLAAFGGAGGLESQKPSLSELAHGPSLEETRGGNIEQTVQVHSESVVADDRSTGLHYVTCLVLPRWV